MGWHKDTVQEIGKYCREKFGSNCVHIDTSDKSMDKFNQGRNQLPDIQNTNTRKDNLYSPDIIIKNSDNNITHIIEVVESSPGSPVSVFGVIITADISISIMKKETTQNSEINPTLIFIIQDPENSYDKYHCSICKKIHKESNTMHFEWMEKEKSVIKEAYETAIIKDNKFSPCPICRDTHRLDHLHYKWFISRLESIEEKEQIIKENKSTRLFEKTFKYKNKIPVSNIELPIYCYQTDYKDYITS